MEGKHLGLFDDRLRVVSESRVVVVWKHDHDELIDPQQL